jgi:signal transduction histidine kinase
MRTARASEESNMKKRVVWAMSLLFAVYGAAELAVQRFVLLPSFVELEQREAEKNVERATAALERELELLEPQCKDWAMWDDAYRYAEDRNEEWPANNLTQGSLAAANIIYAGAYDLEGKKIGSVSLEGEDGSAIPLGPLDEPDLGAATKIRSAVFGENTASGIVRSESGYLLVAGSPIVRGDGTGPRRGTMVMARKLDDEAISKLAEQAQVALTAEPRSPEVEGASTQTGLVGPARYENEETQTVARVDVYDLTGAKAFGLRVDIPREITAKGKQALNFAAISLAIAGVLVVFALLSMLQRMVFTPLSIVTRHAKVVGKQDNVEARLNLEGYLEFDVLASEFDRMLESLADARARLLDQSFRSGVAEMASGVLHNIGNTVVPLSHKLVQLNEELKSAPRDEIRMAKEELEAESTDPERREDLNNFLAFAAVETLSVIERCVDNIESVTQHVSHIQQVLADQHRSSRADRVIEPIRPAAVVSDSLRLLPPELRQGVEIEVDPSVEAMGQARGSRVAVQQIIGNLLINAVEATAGQHVVDGAGKVVVSARTEENGEETHVVISVVDNGMGIRPENLGQLFDRGFSTKNRGSGMGLHWSANTASALGGRLQAFSDGEGMGARFEVWLPAHQPAQALAGDYA